MITEGRGRPSTGGSTTSRVRDDCEPCGFSRVQSTFSGTTEIQQQAERLRPDPMPPGPRARHVEFQDEQGDGDREHGITERLKAAGEGGARGWAAGLVAVHKGCPLASWLDLNGAHLVPGCDTIKARQAGTRNLMATRASLRARSYHASPGEVSSVGGHAQACG